MSPRLAETEAGGVGAVHLAVREAADERSDRALPQRVRRPRPPLCSVSVIVCLEAVGLQLARAALLHGLVLLGVPDLDAVDCTGYDDLRAELDRGELTQGALDVHSSLAVDRG